MPWIPLLQHLSCINWLYLRLPSVLSPFLFFLPFALSGPKFLIAHSPFFPLTTCSLNYTNHQRNCAKSPITVIPTRRRKWVTVISYIELNLCLKKTFILLFKEQALNATQTRKRGSEDEQVNRFCQEWRALCPKCLSCILSVATETSLVSVCIFFK